MMVVQSKRPHTKQDLFGSNWLLQVPHEYDVFMGRKQRAQDRQVTTVKSSQHRVGAKQFSISQGAKVAIFGVHFTKLRGPSVGR